MRPKKDIKESEARIIIYLSVVHPTRKNVTAISNKLGIDYSYVMRILQSMTAKGWLQKHQTGRHMFYDLTNETPLESAKKVYLSNDFQNDLEKYITKDERILPEVKDE